jgi:hypothetical protein
LLDLLQFGDLSGHLLLAGCDPVNAARYLHLAGCDPVDAARHLLLTDSDPLDALPHRVKVVRYCPRLLLIWRRGVWRGKRGRLGSVLRIWCGLRRQPA